MFTERQDAFVCHTQSWSRAQLKRLVAGPDAVHAIVASRLVVSVDVLTFDLGNYVHSVDGSAYIEQTEGFQVVWIAPSNFIQSYLFSFHRGKSSRPYKDRHDSGILSQIAPDLIY
jgi:hypothetical protein